MIDQRRRFAVRAVSARSRIENRLSFEKVRARGARYRYAVPDRDRRAELGSETQRLGRHPLCLIPPA